MATIKRFETGPARATATGPNTPPLSLEGTTGVGLPHPKPAKRSIMLPSRSRCETGFRVTLPSRYAVSSPRRWAEVAWAASCTVIPMTRPKRKATAADGFASKSLRNMDARMIHACQLVSISARRFAACQPFSLLSLVAECVIRGVWIPLRIAIKQCKESESLLEVRSVGQQEQRLIADKRKPKAGAC